MTIEPNIHIVDDDEAVRDSLRLLLESYGLHTRTYKSCEEFSSTFTRAQSECLLLDLHLPGMGGIDFLRTRGGRLGGLPVIMMSGRWDDGTRALAAEVGAVRHIDKPIDDTILIMAVRDVLGRGVESEAPVMATAARP